MPCGWRRWLAGYLAICLILNLIPHYGAPWFRYPGADPDFDVWNMGWPLPLAIHDSRSGLHVFDLAHFVLLALLTGLGILAAFLRAANTIRRLITQRLRLQQGS